MKCIVYLLISIWFAVAAAQAQVFGAWRADELQLPEATATNAVETILQNNGSVREIRVPHSMVLPLIELPSPGINGKTLIYSADLRTELDGRTYLEMLVTLDGQTYFSRGLHDALEGSSPWKTLQTPFYFQDDRQPDDIRLNLVVEGSGTLWVRDIKVSVPEASWMNIPSIGGILGGALGVLLGLFGALAGILVPRAKAKGFMMTLHAVLFLLCLGLLIAGFAAWQQNQVYTLWYAFLLSGLIGILVLGILFPVLRKGYRAAELNKSIMEDV